jgi:hypothetical protein
MANRVLGKAEYRAHRTGGVVTLTAIGEFPNFNDKADFEELPIEIFPPHFGFYFIQKDIGLPAKKPFCYSEVISFPTSTKSITIVDANGSHVVHIEEIGVPEPTQRKPAGSDNGYCVFALSAGGTPGSLHIAQCNSMEEPLLSLYRRVFGPATHEACENYLRNKQS